MTIFQNITIRQNGQPYFTETRCFTIKAAPPASHAATFSTTCMDEFLNTLLIIQEQLITAQFYKKLENSPNVVNVIPSSLSSQYKAQLSTAGIKVLIRLVHRYMDTNGIMRAALISICCPSQEFKSTDNSKFLLTMLPFHHPTSHV